MIVSLNEDYLNQLLDVWEAYQRFYKVTEIDHSRNRDFVKHILEHPEQGQISLYLKNGRVAGFSTLYYTYASTIADRVAVLNDLFVDPEYRQQGIAGELLEHAKAAAKDRGVRYLRWLTQTSNDVAKELYKKYAAPSQWLMYAIKV